MALAAVFAACDDVVAAVPEFAASPRECRASGALFGPSVAMSEGLSLTPVGYWDLGLGLGFRERVGFRGSVWRWALGFRIERRENLAGLS